MLRLIRFASCALCGKRLLLLANRLSLDLSGSFAAGQLEILLAWLIWLSRYGFIITSDERALFTHFNLNGAGTTTGIGLFDLGRRFFNQCDFFARRCSSAVGTLQVRQQLLLVRIGHGICRTLFGHARAGELLQEGFSWFVQLSC